VSEEMSEIYREMAKLFKALANEKRLIAFKYFSLKYHPEDVSEKIGVKRQSLQKHIDVLREMELIRPKVLRSEGRIGRPRTLYVPTKFGKKLLSRIEEAKNEIYQYMREKRKKDIKKEIKKLRDEIKRNELRHMREEISREELKRRVKELEEKMKELMKELRSMEGEEEIKEVEMEEIEENTVLEKISDLNRALDELLEMKRSAKAVYSEGRRLWAIGKASKEDEEFMDIIKRNKAIIEKVDEGLKELVERIENEIGGRQ